ncbi:hypothetical protein V8B55DRAFT_1578977 [Mucor lusitanicus]|uniref:Sequence orphan n=2 Tax=Mucor circinelloides f. lusitanicus TaxID=29924 RepID=A0A168ICQ9_MUCCL|nr:hypothetical protein FB192DRAFT_1436974 [Mucor lusitanicus]OAC99815.1 hypothetical protein MUCCIDRAFT_113258 [Mucor lusitanicus CBS 277.49]
MFLPLQLGLFVLGSFVAAQPVQDGKEAEYMCLDSNFEAFTNKKIKAHQWTPCSSNSDIRNLHPSYLRSSSSASTADQPATSALIDISFKCYHAPRNVCEKAERAFQKAADMISSVILFREPIKVNATLVSFCQMGNECGKNMMTLGGSSPARAMPLLNDDGLLRLHPQALVKQYMLQDHPAFAEYDILSVFNADAPFWFEEDGLPIDSNQADFSFVILHEFMHGLGFYSGWNEYISSRALTPDPSPFMANQLIRMLNPTSTSALHSTQFLESAMDRLMTVLDYDSSSMTISPSMSVSDYTSQLNRIQAVSISDLTTSPGFAAAKEMGYLATKAGSLGLDISPDLDPIVLETALQPFQPGSSISHVDYATYTKSPDFLMRFMQDRGLTLAEAIKRGGGTGPIGPLLLRVFEELGYSTVNHPNTVPPLLFYQQQGMTDMVMNELQSSSHHGLRRKHQHHHNSVNATSKDGHVYISASSPGAVEHLSFDLLLYFTIFCIIIM